MRFRRIYWVTEQFDEDGRSQVTGVFTSVHDLIQHGIGIRDICDKRAGFRVSLVELDSPKMPLCVFASPEFGNVPEALRQFVESGELSADEVSWISEALR